MSEFFPTIRVDLGWPEQGPGFPRLTKPFSTPLHCFSVELTPRRFQSLDIIRQAIEFQEQENPAHFTNLRTSTILVANQSVGVRVQGLCCTQDVWTPGISGIDLTNAELRDAGVLQSSRFMWHPWNTEAGDCSVTFSRHIRSRFNLTSY